MKTAILSGLIFIIAALFGSPARAQDSLDVNKLIREFDQLYRSDYSYSELEMEIVTPHWQRTLAVRAWTRGMDQTLIRIDSPRKEKGMGTLRIESEMWNYLPKTNKVIKVPPSMMMSAWMGSDFTNDDIVREFSLFDDYSYELADVEGPGSSLVYVNCIPREDLPVVWGNIVVALRLSDHLPVWQKYYDEDGRLIRLQQYSDIKEMGGRVLPTTMEMIPQDKEGQKTIIRYNSIKFNVTIPDDVFSLRNLRAVD